MFSFPLSFDWKQICRNNTQEVKIIYLFHFFSPEKTPDAFGLIFFPGEIIFDSYEKLNLPSRRWHFPIFIFMRCWECFLHFRKKMCIKTYLYILSVINNLCSTCHTSSKLVLFFGKQMRNFVFFFNVRMSTVNPSTKIL